MMRKLLILTVLAALIMFTGSQALAALGATIIPTGTDVKFTVGGQIRTQLTLWNQMDFNDKVNDPPLLTEAGLARDFFIRNETRLYFKAEQPGKWYVYILPEVDMIYDKNNADRGYRDLDFPSPSAQATGLSGTQFGIERAEGAYNFGPFWLKTGWDVTAVDIKTGGFVYGDDHPYVALTGTYGDISWRIQLTEINNDNTIAGGGSSPNDADWRFWFAKVDYNLKIPGTGNLIISPFYGFSDFNRNYEANIHYFGLETYGKLGILEPAFEIAFSNGSVERRNPGEPDLDVSSMGIFAALGFDLSKQVGWKVFTPFIGGYWIQGDEKADDKKLEGFVGITNIYRFTPYFGMDGSYVGEHLAGVGGMFPFTAPLYSGQPERRIAAAAAFYGGAPVFGRDIIGGIGAGSTGMNPGLEQIGIGLKFSPDGKLNGKATASWRWFNKTKVLEQIARKSVDDSIGVDFNLNLTYDFDPHFRLGYIFSYFSPGDGVKDFYGHDDAATVNLVELLYTF